MTMPGRRRIVLVVVLALIVLWLWQCTGSFDAADDAEAVTVFGPWLADEADAFAAVLEDFTDSTGITVNYTGTSNFDTDLRARVSRGAELPDLAIVPQPSFIAELVVLDVLQPLSQETVDAIVENHDLTEEQLVIDGNAYLAPYRAAVKSLVWYRPDVFEEHGWTIPATLDELDELTNEIAGADTADADFAAWCFSVESGTSSGWAASDWIEDIVLRRGGPDVYDGWIAGTVEWDDDPIAEAFAEFERLLLEPGDSYGGSQYILSEEVAEASGPLFADPPGCAMYKQANFATNWFPSGTSIGADGDLDFFVLPGVDADEPAPLVRGGDGIIKFGEGEDVDRLATFLVTPEGGEAWADRGGYLSTRDSVDLTYYDEVDRPFAELLREGRVERFDASDLMLSDLRDVLLEQLTLFIGESSHLDDRVDIGSLVAALDAERARLFPDAETEAETEADLADLERPASG
jgi:alpha-glucoside transport system substrate-binding protein